jgi:DNA-binding CsgD family transcriptional regulator
MVPKAAGPELTSPVCSAAHLPGPARSRVGRAAADRLDRTGAAPWADRARAELSATGVTTPRPSRAGLPRLTPQELQVARLAAQGLSNRDIAAQLFLSPRTVGYHLYKAYPKLRVTSRSQLDPDTLGT